MLMCLRCFSRFFFCNQIMGKNGKNDGKNFLEKASAMSQCARSGGSSGAHQTLYRNVNFHILPNPLHYIIASLQW